MFAVPPLPSMRTRPSRWLATCLLPVLLDSVNTGGVNSCSVAMDANGNAIVVWDQDTVNARLDIWANLFR